MRQACKQIMCMVWFCILFLGLAVPFAQADVVFEEDFESGGVSWEINNGIWEIGAPTTGPSDAYSPQSCIATKLNSNYPYSTDSRLISPQIQLPDAVAGEEVLLRFRQYYSYQSADKGYVQINAYDAETGEWEGWKTLKTVYLSSSGWHHARVDLTAYAGQTTNRILS